MYKFRSMYVNAPDLKMEDGSTYNGADDEQAAGLPHLVGFSGDLRLVLRQLIQNLVSIAVRDGNYLLNIGPDGTGKMENGY